MAVTLDTKACSKCGVDKPLDEFHKDNSREDGLHHRCKACKSKQAAGYYKKWTPEQREKHRARVLRTRYGMELDLLIVLYEKQEGCCAICGKHGDRPAINEKRKSNEGVLHVDHDHETGAVRGLLCAGCNSGLGHFGDSAENLVSAANYLLKKGGQ
jgi:hypothetical protein